MTYLIIGSVLAVYYIIMTFVQYAQIAEKDRSKEPSGNSGINKIEQMTFEEQQLQYNLQGSVLNWPATFLAQFIYQLRHRKRNSL